MKKKRWDTAGHVVVALLLALLAGPAVAEPPDWLGNLMFDGELFFLAPRRSGQTFAVVGTNHRWGPVGTVHSLDGNYDPGFRLTAAWRLTDDLDVRLGYAYFHGNADAAVTRPPTGAVFPTLTHPTTLAMVDSATAANSVNFNLFDLELSKRIAVGDSIDLRLFAGPRYANLDQKLNVQYVVNAGVKDDVHRCLSFDGGGVRAGVDSQYRFLNDLGVYLRGSFALLAGQLRGHQYEDANGYGVTEVCERYTRVIPYADLGVGLSYERGRFRLSAGYEFAAWFGLVDGIDFVNDANPAKVSRSAGNLGFDGFVFRAEFAF